MCCTTIQLLEEGEEPEVTALARSLAITAIQNAVTGATRWVHWQAGTRSLGVSESVRAVMLAHVWQRHGFFPSPTVGAMLP